MRGITRDEKSFLVLCVTNHDVIFLNDEQEEVAQRLVKRGLVYIGQDSDGEFYDITNDGRLALRVCSVSK